METINRKNIALAAHETKKQDLIDWVLYNKKTLAGHALFADQSLAKTLEAEAGLSIDRVGAERQSNEQPLAVKISEGTIDILVYFWDPMAQLRALPQANTLLRIATAWNIPMACNRASADFLITSALLQSAYHRQMPADIADGAAHSANALFEDPDFGSGLLLTI